MRIVCTLPNATSPINGHQFLPYGDGSLIGDVPDDEAEAMLTIPGYAAEGPAPDAAEAAVLDTLRARAVELGISVKPAWKEARLQAEIRQAEAAITPAA
ncbi:MAG: hypothetical protein AB9M53_01065 [Leptothrix sp. (in: b-proteobacteria)]